MILLDSSKPTLLGTAKIKVHCNLTRVSRRCPARHCRRYGAKNLGLGDIWSSALRSLRQK